MIVAPLDREEHTYRLDWTASSDSYTIKQDGELYALGVISQDFTGFINGTQADIRTAYYKER